MARKLNFDTKFLVRLNTNQLNKLHLLCETEKISLSEFVRQSIEEKQLQIEIEKHNNNMEFTFE